jgi:hypothetical protein
VPKVPNISPRALPLSIDNCALETCSFHVHPDPYSELEGLFLWKDMACNAFVSVGIVDMQTLFNAPMRVLFYVHGWMCIAEVSVAATSSGHIMEICQFHLLITSWLCNL